MLVFAVRADQQRTPPHVHPPAHRETALHRIAEMAAIGLVDQGKQLGNFPAHRFVAARTRHCLRRPIQVVHPAFVVGGDDAFGNGFQGVLRLATAAAERDLQALAVADVAGNGQYGRRAAILDRRALRFDPEPLLLAVNQLNFELARHFVTGDAFCHGLAKQRPVGRLYQIRNVPADNLLRRQAHESGGPVVCQQNPLVVHDDDLGQCARKIGEQPVTVLDLFVAFAERVEQLVDDTREIGYLSAVVRRQAAANDASAATSTSSFRRS